MPLPVLRLQCFSFAALPEAMQRACSCVWSCFACSAPSDLLQVSCVWSASAVLPWSVAPLHQKMYTPIQCRSAPEAMQRVPLLFGALVSVSIASAAPSNAAHFCSCVIFFSCLALFLKLCSMCALCVSVAAPCDVQRACSAALCSIDFFINTLSIPSQYSLKRFSCLAPDLLPVIRSTRI